MLLYQPTSGYCYNSDSIFLFHFIGTFKPEGNLLDIGCGVGIISLLLSRDFKINTTIIEKQKSMFDYAVHNFSMHQMEPEAHHEDFLTFDTEERYDFIVSNPPFYGDGVTQSENNHLNAARYAHHLPIAEMFRKVKRFLKPRGWFIFCYDAKQIDLLLCSLRDNGMNPEKIVFLHSKIDRESKLVMIAARNNSKSVTQILPPWIVFDEESNYKREAKEAFIKANTHSIKGDF